MRSSDGVGMTPPNVDGAPKPTSSVMVSRTWGAPFSGAIRAGQYGVDCAAFRSIFPPNGAGGDGSCSPLMVVVAPGVPGAPVTCPCSWDADAVGGRCCARACCNPWYVMKSVTMTM